MCSGNDCPSYFAGSKHMWSTSVWNHLYPDLEGVLFGQSPWGQSKTLFPLSSGRLSYLCHTSTRILRAHVSSVCRGEPSTCRLRATLSWQNESWGEILHSLAWSPMTAHTGHKLELLIEKATCFQPATLRLFPRITRVLTHALIPRPLESQKKNWYPFTSIFGLHSATVDKWCALCSKFYRLTVHHSF